MSSSKKIFDIKDIIEEQDLKTLTRLYGDDCAEYITDVSYEAYNESNLNEFLDIVMEDFKNSQEWFERVLESIPTVL